MKFQCNKPIDHGWHRWFAWHPVEVGPNDCRWLEVIERRLVDILDCGSEGELKRYDFRLIEP